MFIYICMISLYKELCNFLTTSSTKHTFLSNLKSGLPNLSIYNKNPNCEAEQCWSATHFLYILTLYRYLNSHTKSFIMAIYIHIWYIFTTGDSVKTVCIRTSITWINKFKAHSGEYIHIYIIMYTLGAWVRCSRKQARYFAVVNGKRQVASALLYLAFAWTIHRDMRLLPYDPTSVNDGLLRPTNWLSTVHVY